MNHYFENLLYESKDGSTEIAARPGTIAKVFEEGAHDIKRDGEEKTWKNLKAGESADWNGW